MRGAAWNKEIHGKELVCAIHNLRMITKRSARNCARTDSYHDLGFRNRLVGLFERQAHVLSDSAGDQEPVGMSWRRHKLNTEPTQIEHHGVQHIDVGFAPVAPACADLPEFERAPKNAIDRRAKAPGEMQVIPFLQDEIVALAGCKSILPSELDRPFRTCAGTFRAE